MNPKQCERCGKEFACGAKDTQCWCAEIPVDDPDLKEIRKKYNDCLCLDCLNYFASKKEP